VEAVQNAISSSIPIEFEYRAVIVASPRPRGAVECEIAAFHQHGWSPASDSTAAESVEDRKAAPVPVQLEHSAIAQIGSTSRCCSIKRSVAPFDEGSLRFQAVGEIGEVPQLHVATSIPIYLEY